MRDELCPKCLTPAMVIPIQSFTIGDPNSIKYDVMVVCHGCHLQKDGDRWVNPYKELKRADDRYRAEQN